MRKEHLEAFDLFTATFSEDTITNWMKMITDWENDHNSPNPFEEPDNSIFFFAHFFSY